MRSLWRWRGQTKYCLLCRAISCGRLTGAIIVSNRSGSLDKMLFHCNLIQSVKFIIIPSHGTATLNGERTHTLCPVICSRTPASSGEGLLARNEGVAMRVGGRTHRETWDGCIVSWTTV